MPTSLSADSLQRLLSRRDLTNPRQGTHALQLLAREAMDAAAEALSLPLRLYRSSGLTPGAGAGPRLHGCAADGLREVLDLLRDEGTAAPHMLACLGPVHAAQQDGAVRLRGHRLAVWTPEAGDEAGLPRLVRQLAVAALPGAGVRLLPDPGTEFDRGFRLDVRAGDTWAAVASCGYLTVDDVRFIGLLLELESALAVRKGLPDAALVHGPDPRVQEQMQDLEPWVPARESACVTRSLQPAG